MIWTCLSHTALATLEALFNVAIMVLTLRYVFKMRVRLEPVEKGK
jgi:hypothetical protein